MNGPPYVGEIWLVWNQKAFEEAGGRDDNETHNKQFWYPAEICGIYDDFERKEHHEIVATIRWLHENNNSCTYGLSLGHFIHAMMPYDCEGSCTKCSGCYLRYVEAKKAEILH
jgi:hypothetical protein